MRHNPGYGIMAKLVQRGAIPVDRFMERRLRRHRHKVMARAIKGLGAADLNPRPARSNQRVGLGNRQHRIGTHHRRNIVLWKPLALVDIEHDKALEERHLPRRAILSPRRFGLGLRREAVGVADDRALLAAPDIAARGFRLAVGEPALRAIAFGDPFGPQDEQ